MFGTSCTRCLVAVVCLAAAFTIFAVWTWCTWWLNAPNKYPIQKQGIPEEENMHKTGASRHPINKTKRFNIAKEEIMKKTELPGIPRTKWISQESPRKPIMKKTKSQGGQKLQNWTGLDADKICLNFIRKRTVFGNLWGETPRVEPRRCKGHRPCSFKRPMQLQRTGTANELPGIYTLFSSKYELQCAISELPPSRICFLVYMFARFGILRLAAWIWGTWCTWWPEFDILRSFNLVYFVAVLGGFSIYLLAGDLVYLVCVLCLCTWWVYMVT